MAHEISNVNGTDECAFAMQPAWHGLGTVLDNVPNSEEMLQAAHLDWTVEMQPIRTQSGIEIPDNFATVRTDCNAVLGVVGTRYQIVQNRESFDFLDSLLQDGVMKYESAGALRGGRIVWALARLPSVDEIAEGDNSLRYVLFSTSHDGSAGIHAIPTSVRVVCANTLRVATAGDIGFRHTGNVTSKLEEARRYLSQFDSGFTLYRDKARILAQRRYTPAQAKDYVNTLFPEVSAEESKRGHTIREKRIDEVRKNFTNNRQRLPSIAGSFWALFNAVTETVDHAEKSQKLDRAGRETKMMSVIDGTGADFKTRAFDLALTMAS